MKPEILLIHPPNLFNPKAFRRAILSPMMMGYGLLHLAAHLKNCGYQVECWNIPLLYQLGFDNDHIQNIFKGYDPILIGIELNWLHLSKGALDLAKFCKELFPHAPIIVGGVHTTLFASQIIKAYENIDIAVQGEAEKIVEDIAAKIEKRQNYSNVVGLITRKEKKIIINEGKNIYEDIDEIPPYSCEYIMPKTLNPYNLAAINTCRGPCNYDCVYCVGATSCYTVSPRSEIAFHSISWIIKQIKILLNYVDRICIQDYNYCNPKFIMKLTEAIQQESLQDLIEYFNYALVPIPKMNRELMHNLAKAGVDNIDLGIESGSDYILKILKRPYTVQHAAVVIKNAVKNGILPKTYWMISGFERTEDLIENKKFLQKTIEMGAVPRWVTPLCVIPETQLYKNPDRYQLNLKMCSFEDYKIFSTEKSNRNAYYSNCITHETNQMKVYDILRAVNDLKSYIVQTKDLIFKKLEENKMYYEQAHPKLYEDIMVQRAKIRLKAIRGTFF
ncbi:MAG: B12-binding domain-containing radical SAM protein [Candidatus Helarchaeota archaeon]